MFVFPYKNTTSRFLNFNCFPNFLNFAVSSSIEIKQVCTCVKDLGPCNDRCQADCVTLFVRNLENAYCTSGVCHCAFRCSTCPPK